MRIELSNECCEKRNRLKNLSIGDLFTFAELDDEEEIINNIYMKVENKDAYQGPKAINLSTGEEYYFGSNSNVVKIDAHIIIDKIYN